MSQFLMKRRTFLFASMLAAAQTACARFGDGSSSSSENNEVHDVNVVIDKLTPSDTSSFVSSFNQRNAAWCATFNMVWNDMRDALHSGKPYSDDDISDDDMPVIVNEMDTSTSDFSTLSDDISIHASGLALTSEREALEHKLKEQFDKTSDVLGDLEWFDSVDDMMPYLYIFFYAAIINHFKFDPVFSSYTDKLFYGADGSERKVAFFGTRSDDDSSERDAMLKNLYPLFYDDDSCKAVAIKPKCESDTGLQDIVVLAQGLEGTTVSELWQNLITHVKERDANNWGTGNILVGDFLVPCVSLDVKTSFDELVDWSFKPTSLPENLGVDVSLDDLTCTITKALQTLRFSMDEAGVIVESEAAVEVMLMNSAVDMSCDFVFNGPFVVFVLQTDKNDVTDSVLNGYPYVAISVTNIEE